MQIWNISGQIWKYSGKPENENFFRDHTNPTRKEEKILVKTVFENTLYIWKYIVLNIRADSSCLFQTVLLSCYDITLFYIFW